MSEPPAAADSSTPSGVARRPKNHAWIWFYAFIILASVFVTFFMIWFNWSIQLKPEVFQANRQRWKEQALQDYNMIYTKRINDAPEEKYSVKVRGGNVQEALMNGMPLDAETRIYHSMDRLFGDVDRFMNLDTKKGATPVYVTAVFDEKTGAIRKYIRRVMGSSQRVEIQTKIEGVKQ